MPHQCTNCGREFPDGSKEMLSGCPDCGSNKFQFVPSGGTDESVESAPESEADEETDYSFGEWPETAKRPVEKDAVSASDDASEADEATSGEVAGESDTSASDRPASRSASDRTASSKSPSDSGRSESSRSPAEADDSASPSSDPTTDGSTEASDGDSSAHAEASDGPPRTGAADGPASEEDVEENAAQASARTEMVSTDELPEASSENVPTDPTTDFDRLREELNDQFESIRVVSPGTYELNLMELYDRQEYIISLREDGRYVIEMPDAWDSPDD